MAHDDDHDHDHDHHDHDDEPIAQHGEAVEHKGFKITVMSQGERSFTALAEHLDKRPVTAGYGACTVLTTAWLGDPDTPLAAAMKAIDEGEWRLHREA